MAPLPAFRPAWSMMMIRLRPSDPETCDDLAFFLRRHDCRAELAEDGTVLVELPHLFHDEQAQMEVVSASVFGRFSTVSSSAPISATSRICRAAHRYGFERWCVSKLRCAGETRPCAPVRHGGRRAWSAAAIPASLSCTDEASEYAEHLSTVVEEGGQWLVRCPRSGAEWVKDFPLDPAAREWVGTCRLRRFPLTPASDIANPS